MKKNSLLKVLGVCFFIAVFLSWVMPSGSFSNGTFTSGGYNPIGILDLIRLPISTLSGYAGYVLFILAVGGLYGVMNQTGAYPKLVGKLSKKFKHKEVKFAIISILFFTILSSVTGLNFVLFILVPFFMAVMLRLGFTKLATIMSTIGAILVGNIASTYGFDVCGYLNYYLELDINNNIFTKVIFLVILVFLLIMFVTRHKMLDKKLTKEESKEVDIPLLDDEMVEKRTKKSYMPMVVVVLFAFILLLVACYNWSYAIGFSGFEELYEKIVAVEIKGFPILKKIIGNFSPFGYWDITEITMVVVLTSILIAWLYSLKLNDFIEGFKKGAKEVLNVALIVALANIIIALTLGSSTGTSVYYTLTNYVLNFAGHIFNAVVVGGVTFFGGLFINDFPYFVNYMIGNVTTVLTNSSVYSLIAFVMQSGFGIMMLILPTSVLLMAGLSYLKVSYKEWIKYAWKYILETIIIALIIAAVMSFFL